MTRGKKVDIEEYLTNIRPYLEAGCSLYEACNHALIPYTTVIDYQNNDEDIRKKIERMQNVPILAALQVVTDDVRAGNVDTAKWYLERKRKQEFSTKSEVSADVSVNVVSDILKDIDGRTAGLPADKE